jgi:thiol:disulfide interchange protein DsbC
MKKKILGFLLVILASAFLVYTGVTAETKAEKGSLPDPKAAVQREMTEAGAMEIFKKIFPNFKSSGIRKSPVAGLYEIEGGANILLFDPKGELIIFGEVLNKDGKNLTMERRDELAALKLAQIPLDKAVKIGNGQKAVVLFTDPDCPYCRKVSEYLKTADNITQYVFFYPLKQLHPNAEIKVMYILSQKDPGKAYQDVMSGMLDKTNAGKMKTDEKAASRLAEHIAVANKVGVGGTPVMWINGKYVAGANMPMIEMLLKPVTPKINSGA